MYGNGNNPAIESRPRSEELPEPRRSEEHREITRSERTEALSSEQRVLPNRSSIGHHISALGRDATRLIQDEVQLAKLEMSEKIDRATTGVTSLGAGAVLILCGLITLCGAATFGLAQVLPLWASAAIVGGVVLLIGLIALTTGRSKMASAVDPVPHAAIAEAKATSNLFKERTR